MPVAFGCSRFAAGHFAKSDGRQILVNYARIGGFTLQERAEAILQRIIAIASKRDVPAEAIRVEDRGTWTEILAGNERIATNSRTDNAQFGG